MSHKALPHKSRARRRKGRGKGQTEAPVQASPSGTPRYLKAPKHEAADLSSASEREARGRPGTVSQSPVSTPLGRDAAEVVNQSQSETRPLTQADRSAAETALGESFAGVELVEDSPIAISYGAHALTFDGQIHVAPGMPSLASEAGQSLLAHELTHVAQQRKFGSTAAQFRIATTSSDEADTGLGQMDIDFSAQHFASSGNDGMAGTIDFTPYSDAPYSNRIGLIQVADLEMIQTDGTTQDHVWTGGEARREDVKNDQGSFVDKAFARMSPGASSEQWYGAEYSSLDDSTQSNHFGWNRGANDIGTASLWDGPGGSVGHRFSFETVAKARDSDAIYGLVRWGFDVTGRGTTGNEWKEIPKLTTSGGASPTSDSFDSALANYRDVIQHEPEIIYFDTNVDVPNDTELAKLADAGSYMASHPDVQIELEASADTRGSAAYNRALAIRRMNSVHTHLLGLGVDASRITRLEASAGESDAQGSQDAALRHTAGSYQANRRVTVRYRRTASTSGSP